MTDESVRKPPGLFDYLESINSHKVDLMVDEAAEKAYDAFMVRRGLGMSKETIFLAARMNELHHLPDYMQYQYLLETVPKKKRFEKWAKKTPVSDDIKIIARHYQVNMTVASSYRKLMSEEQMEALKELVSGGGADKAVRKKK